MFVIVGDVVSSRRISDETALLDGLHRLLATVNARVPAALDLEPVVRDEFHGAYASAAAAIEATLRLRLLAGELVLATDAEDEPVDIRIGIGHGATMVSSAGTRSGSAWFHARDARAAAQDLPGRSGWPPSLRTVCRGDDATTVAHLNAYLLCQDQLLARMDARDRRALKGLLDGERQVDVAAELGITQPAIARRVKERGALAIHQSLIALRGVTTGGQVPTMPATAARRGPQAAPPTVPTA